VECAEESDRHASGVRDTSELDERYGNPLRSAIVTAISPPVFILETMRFGREGSRPTGTAVPASGVGPRMIFKGEQLGREVKRWQCIDLDRKMLECRVIESDDQ